MNNEPKEFSPYIWWAKQIILVLIGFFFFLFGIQILISAYQLKDPFSFIMTFFASNLIILISAAMIISFIYRMVLYHRNIHKKL